MQNEPPRGGYPDDDEDDDDIGDGRREPRLGGGPAEADPEFPRITGGPAFSAGERPTPPEPDIVYTPEEFEDGGSSMTRWLVGGGAIIALMLGALAAIWLSGSNAPTPPAASGQAAQTPETAAPAQTGAMTPPPASAPETISGGSSTIPGSQLPPPAVPGATAPQTVPPAAAPQAAAPVQTPPATVPAPVAPVTQEAPAETPAPSAPATAKPAAPAKPATAARGAYGLQFAAVSERAAADKEIAKLKSSYSSVLGGHAFKVESAQVSGKTLYRIVATGFASREAANSACARIKSGGGACFVRAPK
ncbi:MAG: SPOR domain-containing protein [Parvibaculaceae bacterium]|nr:SPOR domain-containing protein [Parvibaculaceae bacterium]